MPREATATEQRDLVWDAKAQLDHASQKGE